MGGTPNNSDWPDTYKDLEIKKVVFYKARYGEIEYFDLAQFDKQTINEITNRIILCLRKR
ncbi:hypothetical protein BC2926_29380 [Bacillus cereus]|nr:hypothetical protein BC2926_29380 [Bacillus cereus]